MTGRTRLERYPSHPLPTPSSRLDVVGSEPEPFPFSDRRHARVTDDVLQFYFNQTDLINDTSGFKPYVTVVLFLQVYLLRWRVVMVLFRGEDI